MDFKLPGLAYSYKALEPYIDAQTMELHHRGHHAAYVNALDKLSTDVTKISTNTIYDLIANLRRSTKLSSSDRHILTTHGGGHYNHSLFWSYMAPGSGEQLVPDELETVINSDFGSVDKFREEFTQKALSVFGSGWCWWVFNKHEKKTCIRTSPNQENPVMEDGFNVCLLGLDVWEHAYYLKYQNKRTSYIDAWWNIVNWDTSSRIYNEIAVNGKQLVVSNDGVILFDRHFSDRD